MKVAVRLAILVAALLLVTNMAFAFCDQFICYDIVATYENGNTNTDYWEVCLNNVGNGTLTSDNTDSYYELYLFGGGPGWFNTRYFMKGYPNLFFCEMNNSVKSYNTSYRVIFKFELKNIPLSEV